MASYSVNQKAVAKAKALIAAHQYVLDSSWGDDQPSSDDTEGYLDRHGWDAFGEWFLAVDPDAGEETKGRYHFPYGDFRRVHRSGVIAAKQRASQNDHTAIEEAADELLTLLDDTSGGG